MHFEFLISTDGKIFQWKLGRGAGFGVADTLVSNLSGMNIPKINLGLQLNIPLLNLIETCQIPMNFEFGGVRYLSSDIKLRDENGCSIFQKMTNVGLERIQILNDINNAVKDTDGYRSCSIMFFSNHNRRSLDDLEAKIVV